MRINEVIQEQSSVINEEDYDQAMDYYMSKGYSVQQAKRAIANSSRRSYTPRRSYQQKPQTQQQKPQMVGIHFFNVPEDQEERAKQLGLTKTKSGKWGFKMYNTSGKTAQNKVAAAEQEFGKSRYWQPK
tara:strand:- start:5310 stop:5696 length:387 start_codon:yes stop_codon:yes gene_type:complete